MKKLLPLFITFVVVFSITSFGVLANEVYNVDSGTNYTTIQEAVNDANSSQVLHVYPGTYYEDVSVDVYNLSIKGVDENGTLIDGTQDEIVIVDANDTSRYTFNILQNEVELSGLVVKGGKSGVVVQDSENVVVSDLVSENNLNFGVYLQNTNHSNIDNVITRNQDNQHGIAIEDGSFYNVIENSESYGNFNGFAINRDANHNTIRDSFAWENENAGVGIFTGPWNPNYDTIDQEEGPTNFSIENNVLINNSEGVNVKTSLAEYEGLQSGDWGYNDGGNVSGTISGNTIEGNTKGIEITDANENATISLDVGSCNSIIENTIGLDMIDVNNDGEIGDINININDIYNNTNLSAQSDSPSTLDMTENYWGTIFDDEINSNIDGNIDYNPILDSSCSGTYSTMEALIPKIENVSISFTKPWGDIGFSYDSQDCYDYSAEYREVGENDWTKVYQLIGDANGGFIGGGILDEYTTYETRVHCEVDSSIVDSTNDINATTMPQKPSLIWHTVHFSPMLNSVETEVRYRSDNLYENEVDLFGYYRKQGEENWTTEYIRTFHGSDLDTIVQDEWGDMDSNTSYQVTVEVVGKDITEWEKYRDYWSEADYEKNAFISFGDDEADECGNYNTINDKNSTTVIPWNFSTKLEPPSLLDIDFDISASDVNVKNDLSLGDYDSIDYTVHYKEGKFKKWNDTFDTEFNDQGLAGGIMKYDGDLYYGGNKQSGGQGDGYFAKYNMETGESTEVVSLPGRPQSLLIQDDLLMTGGVDGDHFGFVTIYNITNDSKVWEKTGIAGSWIPTVKMEDGVVYYYSSGYDGTKKVFGYDLDQNETVFNVSGEGLIHNGVKSGVVYTDRTNETLGETNISAFNSTTEELIWKMTFDEATSGTSITFDGDIGYLFSNCGHIKKIDLATQTVVWEKKQNEGFSRTFPLLDKDKNILLTRNGGHNFNPWIYGRDTSTGEVVFRFFEEHIFGNFDYDNGIIYSQTNDNGVQTYDINNLKTETVQITEEGTEEIEIGGLVRGTTYGYFTSGVTNPEVMGEIGTFETAKPDLPVSAKFMLALIPLVMIAGLVKYMVSVKTDVEGMIKMVVLIMFVVMVATAIASFV